MGRFKWKTLLYAALMTAGSLLCAGCSRPVDSELGGGKGMAVNGQGGKNKMNRLKDSTSP